MPLSLRELLKPLDQLPLGNSRTTRRLEQQQLPPSRLTDGLTIRQTLQSFPAPLNAKILVANSPKLPSMLDLWEQRLPLLCLGLNGEPPPHKLWILRNPSRNSVSSSSTGKCTTSLSCWLGNPRFEPWVVTVHHKTPVQLDVTWECCAHQQYHDLNPHATDLHHLCQILGIVVACDMW